jgi:hypothetical protein
LQDVSVDRGWEAVQRLGMQTLRTLEGVNPALRVVHVRERVRLGKPATWETNALSTEAHIQECRLVIVVARVVPEVVQLFTLELVLDSFAIRCIPNQRKNGSDSLDQHGPLRDIGVVERRLRSTISVKTMAPTLCPHT